jgi:hypothetical protein
VKIKVFQVFFDINFHYVVKKRPVVTAEWLALLLRIRKVSCSNLGPETGYREGYRGFTQSHQENVRDSTLK